MRIEIERNVNVEATERELYVLQYNMPVGLALVEVHHQSRATKRHKYRTTAMWDGADERPYRSRLPRPKAIPLNVLKAALDKVCKEVMSSTKYIGSYNYKDKVG